MRALLMMDVETFYSTRMVLGATSSGAVKVLHDIDADDGVCVIDRGLTGRVVGADGERR